MRPSGHKYGGHGGCSAKIEVPTVTVPAQQRDSLAAVPRCLSFVSESHSAALRVTAQVFLTGLLWVTARVAFLIVFPPPSGSACGVYLVLSEPFFSVLISQQPSAETLAWEPLCGTPNKRTWV